MRRVITESVPLARSVMVRSLALEAEAVIVKDPFVKAMSWLSFPLDPCGCQKNNPVQHICSLLTSF